MNEKTKKELKVQYKEHKFRIGVYQIRNTKNNHTWIEGSTNIDGIWNRHIFELRHGHHRNVLLQKEWIEYKEDSFGLEILSLIKQDEALLVNYKKEVKELESMYLKEIMPYGNLGHNKL